MCTKSPHQGMGFSMYLTSIVINRDSFPTQEAFPFNVPVFQKTPRLDFTSPVTFFVGDNGTGKSALIDAIARKAGFQIGRAHV